MGFFNSTAGRVIAGAATGGQSEVVRFAAGALRGGGGGGELYSRQLLEGRKAQIADFASQLSLARQKYLSSLNSMYDKAYARFTGNAEASLAGRGLSVRGGAFASTLAKETSRYQSELEPLAFQAEREDLGTIDSAYANLFNTHFGADSSERLARYDRAGKNSQAIGQFAGMAGLTLLGAAVGGPPGAAAGAKIGSSMGSGSFGTTPRVGDGYNPYSGGFNNTPTRRLNLFGSII
jgi:hypothetical protein